MDARDVRLVQALILRAGDVGFKVAPEEFIRLKAIRNKLPLYVDGVTVGSFETVDAALGFISGWCSGHQYAQEEARCNAESALKKSRSSTKKASARSVKRKTPTKRRSESTSSSKA